LTVAPAGRTLDRSALRTPDQRLRVFVSSTLGELAAERRAVARAISALRLTPVMFELGARPHPPTALYRAYLGQSDIFIGLYWQSYGFIGAEMDRSGLEDEFERSAGLPRLLYLKLPAPKRDPRLTELLARIEREASYRTFRTATELGRLVRDDLATLLSERFTVAAAATRPALREPRPFPVATTSLVGRAQAIEEVADLLARPGVRLVTITGPSGVGKTRVALAVGQRVRDRLGSTAVLVPLAATMQRQDVAAAIGGALDVDLVGVDAPVEALGDRLADGRWLLVLDNVEQVVGAAPELEELLAHCPRVTILATSLTPLGLRAEREYVLPPLSLPADPASVTVDELARSPAVALFVERARAVRPDFELTERNAAAVGEICRRLEGLPLAIELAAARTRLLNPRVLLARLARSLDALGTGAVDMPERHHTLRATVDWSVGLLGADERWLLDTAAVFVDGWTVEAAAEVAQMDEDRVLELIESLARHSLIQLHITDLGPRSRMLDTIRAFVAEGLAARPDAAEIARRHADHYRAMAERADLPLRRFGPEEETQRLQADAGNLAAAVRWYLAHDTSPLPHLFRVLAPFRVLWPFWGLGEGIMGEARVWIDQLLPTAGTFDSRKRTELLWTAVVTALEASDDAAAMRAAEALAECVDAIDDVYLQAVSKLAIAWTAVLSGDTDGVQRAASASLALLRSQDEPLWTSLVLMSLGGVATAQARYDDARRAFEEARDLADRFDNVWLAAFCRAQMGVVAMATGRRADAHRLVDESLDLSLATQSVHTLTYCLMRVAEVALAEEDADRAAVVAGAADTLRRRAGLRVWTSLRGDDALTAEIRSAAGPERFDDRFAAGARLDAPSVVAFARAPGSDAPATRRKELP
jgi:predicted ATPase